MTQADNVVRLIIADELKDANLEDNILAGILARIATGFSLLDDGSYSFEEVTYLLKGEYGGISDAEMPLLLLVLKRTELAIRTILKRHEGNLSRADCDAECANEITKAQVTIRAVHQSYKNALDKNDLTPLVVKKYVGEKGKLQHSIQFFKLS